MQPRTVFFLAVLSSAPSVFAGARELAYADEVIQYDPLLGGRAPKRNMDPRKALGKPGGAYQDVSLGHGGLLELAFVEHLITNSGDLGPDLQIHEVGPDVEGMYVALQPADEETAKAIGFHCLDERKPFGDGFCEIGLAGGGITDMDIDRYFPGFEKGTLHFNAIQLIDDERQGDDNCATLGADIDGVVALYPAPVAHSVWNMFGPPRTDGAPPLVNGGKPKTPASNTPTTPTNNTPSTPSTPTPPVVVTPPTPGVAPSGHSLPLR